MLPAGLLDRFQSGFKYGSVDCCQFAAAAWKHYTGEDLALGFSYSSEAEALKLIEAAGSMEELLTRLIGEPRDDIRQAQDGDIVLSSAPGIGPIVGVADPPIFWVLAKKGMAPVNLDKAIKVWPCRQ